MAITVPGYVYDPLSGEQTEPPMTGHDVVCVHTMVGTFGGTEGMFEKDGFHGTDSTFGLRGDGYAEQWQDMRYQTDANLDGNPYVLSIECEDTGKYFPDWDHNTSNVPAFTDAQVDTLVDLIGQLCDKDTHRYCPSHWRCHNEGIPPVLIPDTKLGRRGIGYHRQGIEPWLVPGGVRWSNAKGKVCPGDRRVNQLINVIIPRIITPAPIALMEDDDMTFIKKRSNGYTAIVCSGKVFAVTGPNNWQEAINGGVPHVVLDDDEYDRIVGAFPVVN